MEGGHHDELAVGVLGQNLIHHLLNGLGLILAVHIGIVHAEAQNNKIRLAGSNLAVNIFKAVLSLPAAH